MLFREDYPLVAEAMAFLRGTRFSLDNHLNRCVSEGDAQLVVDAIKDQSKTPKTDPS